MRTSKTILGSVVLGLMLVTACGKDGKGTKSPDGEAAKGGAVLNPEKASAEAKADFAKVAERYESAKKSGSLSGGQCDEFAKDFKNVYDRHGKQMTIAWFNAGAVWEECGDLEKAEQIYLDITQKVPNYDLAYNNLGAIYWNRKQEAKALDYFKRAVKVNPKTRAPRNNLAAALRDKYASSPDQKDFEEAEKSLQNVLAVDSANRAAYENLARLYYDRGRLKDKSYLLLSGLVVDQATRVLKKDRGTESADLHNIAGLLFMEQDNQVDALREFKKAAEIEPNHADANMNIAMISIRFRDYAQAEKSLGIALKDKRQKRNIEAYLGLGVAQRGMRKYKEAEASFKKAQELQKNDPRPMYNLGILYQEHIATSSDQFSKAPYETAKEYFNKFASQAGGKAEYKTTVEDAKNRVANIDQLFKDIEEMKKLEEEAKRLAEQQKKAEEEERKRLLDLEKKAQQAAGGGGGAAPAPAKEPPKDPAAPAPKK